MQTKPGCVRGALSLSPVRHQRSSTLLSTHAEPGSMIDMKAKSSANLELDAACAGALRLDHPQAGELLKTTGPPELVKMEQTEGLLEISAAPATPETVEVLHETGELLEAAAPSDDVIRLQEPTQEEARRLDAGDEEQAASTLDHDVLQQQRQLTPRFRAPKQASNFRKTTPSKMAARMPVVCEVSQSRCRSLQHIWERLRESKQDEERDARQKKLQQITQEVTQLRKQGEKVLGPQYTGLKPRGTPRDAGNAESRIAAAPSRDDPLEASKSQDSQQGGRDRARAGAPEEPGAGEAPGTSEEQGQPREGLPVSREAAPTHLQRLQSCLSLSLTRCPTCPTLPTTSGRAGGSRMRHRAAAPRSVERAKRWH